jgi:manganese transport protein
MNIFSKESFRNLIPRELLRYLGPGFIVTVGFIDPGNWATNIEGGSRFGYDLLWVITLSTIMLIVLQNFSAKIGIVTGKSLAANIHSNMPRPVSAFLGFTIFIACIATDIAELLGGALGFHLLFGLPLWIGALLTLIIVIVVIIGQKYHSIERMILGFLSIIAFCYFIELFIVKPDMMTALRGTIIPIVNYENIFIAMAILGAVVMPHNIYLHSNVILSRDWGSNDTERRRLIGFEKIDTLLSMGMGWMVNSSMIIVAAAVFYENGVVITSIEQASETLKPLAGNLAQLLFGIALLFSGIGSSITSSFAEANVFTAFLGKPENPESTFYRIGLIATAIPAFIVIISGIDTFKILIFSQLVLSIQLPFTIIPLIYIARKKKIMEDFRIKGINYILGLVIAAVVIGLNLYLLTSF